MSYEGQYHPKLVNATVGGPVAGGGLTVAAAALQLPQGVSLPYTVQGKSADNFFATANTSDMVTMAVGADGGTTHVVNADESGNFTLTLKHGTFACFMLSRLFRAQRLIGQGQLPPFTFPVTYRDPTCTPAETHEALNCLILRQPDMSFGASLADVTWGFVAATVISNFGARIP